MLALLYKVCTFIMQKTLLMCNSHVHIEETNNKMGIEYKSGINRELIKK